MVCNSKKMFFVCLIGFVGAGCAMESEDADQGSKKFASISWMVNGEWRPVLIDEISSVVKPRVLHAGQMRPKPLVAMIDQVPYDAVSDQRLDELVQMLAHASCINDSNRDGDTALHIACKNSCLQQAVILVRAIVENEYLRTINTPNEKGKTALQLLIERFEDRMPRQDSECCHAMLKLLTEHGAHFGFDGLEVHVLSKCL